MYNFKILYIVFLYVTSMMIWSVADDITLLTVLSFKNFGSCIQGQLDR